MKKKSTILIVDDDQFLLDMYALKFDQGGFDAVLSSGGEDAIKKLKDGLKPDVILTDILMPSIDGFDLIKRIKDENLAPDAKIIILSNKGEKADVEKGKTVGADDYVIKANAIPSEVLEKVQNILQEK